MKKALAVTLIVGFLVVDFLFFHDIMKQAGLDHPPCTVTADYAIKLIRPTPTDQPIELRARVIESKEDRAIVEGELIAHEKVCATCQGTFVAVKPGHPAYHRW